MWTPFDASLLLFRRPEVYREAFSLVPEYLRTANVGAVHNYNEYGVQLGRRFRALKVWFLLRWFGAQGMADRLREHLRLARVFAERVDADPAWERMAPVPLATVCLRYRQAPEDRLDAINEAILERVNASGRIFLSHTRLKGRFTLRVSIGNPRTTEAHLDQCWRLLQEAAKGI
jgi:aromatic-L-amino-acid decarboxylase